jgi:L-asparaginase
MNPMPRVQASEHPPLLWPQEGRRPKAKLLLLYTGGTMGMMPDPKTGALAPVPGYFTQQILNMAEMKHPRMPEFDIVEYDPLLDSACMGPANWVQMAGDVEKNYYSYDGFVIIMGTDTMAYAASALSFMLENLGKTVVFTGSQIPFCEVYNDARRNLIISMLFAGNQDYAEVCVFFNDRLLRGNRSSKVNR